MSQKVEKPSLSGHRLKTRKRGKSTLVIKWFLIIILFKSKEEDECSACLFISQNKVLNDISIQWICLCKWSYSIDTFYWFLIAFIFLNFRWKGEIRSFIFPWCNYTRTDRDRKWFRSGKHRYFLKCRFVPRSKALLAYDQYCHVPFLAGTFLCHFPLKFCVLIKWGNSKCTGENKYCIMYQNKE